MSYGSDRSPERQRLADAIAGAAAAAAALARVGEAERRLADELFDILEPAVAAAEKTQPMAGRKTIQFGDEPAAHRSHQRRGRQRLPTVFAEEVHRPQGALQPRDINVQIHPVDRLDRQPHMIAEDRRDILCIIFAAPVVRFCPSKGA